MATDKYNDILDQQIPLQQPCPKDIHAVLREMTALVAEQKVKITFLEKENQDNVAKLKELEKKETEIDKLKQQLQDQVAKLEELERQTKEIHDIKQQLQVKRVAFSASLLDKGDGHTGPFNAHTTLIFKRVFTNIGNAYNPHTGIFTAPVRGAYHFEWYIGAYGDASHGTCAVLFKNGEHIFAAWEHQPSHFGTSSNAATLVLEVGDQAFCASGLTIKYTTIKITIPPSAVI